MTETERQLCDERNELIRKCQRLTKALSSASQVAYSRGYEQGVADAVVANPPVENESPYGYCPRCGHPGVKRERRPNGNDTCAIGCVYPSATAVASP